MTERIPGPKTDDALVSAEESYAEIRSFVDTLHADLLSWQTELAEFESTHSVTDSEAQATWRELKSTVDGLSTRTAAAMQLEQLDLREVQSLLDTTLTAYQQYKVMLTNALETAVGEMRQETRAQLDEVDRKIAYCTSRNQALASR